MSSKLVIHGKVHILARDAAAFRVARPASWTSQQADGQSQVGKQIPK